LDADRVTLDLEVRTWLPGDCFYPFGLQGHQKKLQDFFTDRKIPRARRTRIPLVVAPEGIVWIGGYRMDDRFRVMPATTHMVRLTLIGDDGVERL
jgi:tRNA(Ile)-lysidine synthase